MAVRKSEDGKHWTADVSLGVGADGKYIRRKKTDFAKKSHAEEWERSILNLKDSGIDITRKDYTFREIAGLWDKNNDYKAEINDLEWGTLKKYKNNIRIFEEYCPFHKKIARKVTKNDIENFLAFLAKKGFAENSILTIRASLSGVFLFGIDNDLLAKNPVKKAKMPQNMKETEERSSYTAKEIRLIKKYINEPFGDVVYFMVCSGLRVQEVCAIDSDSRVVRNEAPFLRVDKAMKRQEKGPWKAKKTKTKKSKRELPLSREMDEILQKRLLACPPDKNGKRYFIPGKNGIISYTYFRKRYKDFIQGIKGLRYLVPHECRHTFSSQAEENDVDPFMIQELMGHANPKMTRKYTHISDEKKIKAIEKMQQENKPIRAKVLTRKPLRETFSCRVRADK